MNLLILSVSKKVQLIKKLKNACHLVSRKLFCADMSINAPALYFGDDFKIFPSYKDKTFLSVVVKYCHNKNISLIIPTSDRDMAFLIKERPFLLKNGIRVLMSESSSIQKCLSNFCFIKTCIDNDFPIPTVYSSINDIEYPCVAKLDSSQAANGVFFLNNEIKLNQILKKYQSSEFIFQKYVNSNEYSIDAFYGHTGELVSAVARERVEVINGESIITETKDIPELINLARNISSVFKFWGHITIQAFYDGSEVSLIEINPRFGGASSLSIQAGLETPQWTLNLIDNPLFNPSPVELKYNLKLLRYSEDFFL